MTTPDVAMGADDPLAAALAELNAYGLIIDRLETDGVLHRVQHQDDKPAKKDGWYVARELSVGPESRRLVVGVYGWWKDGETHKITQRGRGLTQSERAALAQQRRDVQRAAKLAREQKAAQAAERAAKIWDGLPELGGSEYLRRKGVRAWGVRFTRGTIVIPLRLVDGSLTGLQFIAGDGGKKFLTGSAVKSAHHMIGKPASDMPLVIAEGYATAATIHQTTGWPVAVAYDCGNLQPVALVLRKAYPTTSIIIAGDDDARTAGNPGRTKALAAAEAVSGRAVFPEFTGTVPGTDWNDLAATDGEAVVRRQLLGAVGEVVPPPPPDRVDGALLRFDLSILLEHYVLIYGTETVFDARVTRILTLSSLRAAAGKSLVRMWMEHDGRRLVLPENVVFEPNGQCSANEVNLFRGWPIKPRLGDVTMVLGLLDNLCHEDDDVFHWVLKWCAYPLQNPGAKMRTAIIMHGPEGTGKNMFWGLVRDIYGEYGAIISQSELESQFNAWCSRKLFVIGNEVVSRQEMYHQKGKIKNMITEPEWAVNEKMLPVRMESNHANFVFLSNSLQPATPDQDDRRYLVVWTPPPLEDRFYAAAAREIRKYGPEAFYHYLMSVDLSGFNEHTKPPVTSAKTDLIEASMESHEMFFRRWSAGELEAAFAPCSSASLYAYYRRWCETNGERFILSARMFTVAVGKKLRRERVWHTGYNGRKRSWGFFPDGWMSRDDVAKEVVIGDAFDQFDKDAGISQ